MELDVEMIEVYYKNETIGPEGKYKAYNWKLHVKKLVQQLRIIFDLPAK